MLSALGNGKNLESFVGLTHNAWPSSWWRVRIASCWSEQCLPPHPLPPPRPRHRSHAAAWLREGVRVVGGGRRRDVVYGTTRRNSIFPLGRSLQGRRIIHTYAASPCLVYCDCPCIVRSSSVHSTETLDPAGPWSSIATASVSVVVQSKSRTCHLID